MFPFNAIDFHVWWIQMRNRLIFNIFSAMKYLGLGLNWFVCLCQGLLPFLEITLELAIDVSFSFIIPLILPQNYEKSLDYRLSIRMSVRVSKAAGTSFGLFCVCRTQCGAWNCIVHIILMMQWILIFLQMRSSVCREQATSSRIS